jgi:hypothetical protein
MQIKILLEDLIFTQQEVEEAGINDYIKRIQNGESFKNLYGRFCKHSNKFYVLDGHHRAYTLYNFFGIREIILDYDDCSKSGTHKLSQNNPCIIQEDFYVFNGTIHDLKIVNYDSLQEE